MKANHDKKADAVYIELGNQRPDGVIEICFIPAQEKVKSRKKNS